MKQLLLISLLALHPPAVFGQSADLRRTIEVSGSADEEVTPDLLTVTISLQEYLGGKKKVTIGELQQQLESALDAGGIPRSDLRIDDIAAWENTWKKKSDPAFLASKQYSLRLHELSRFDRLLAALDPRAIRETRVSSYDFSGMKELRRSLNIRALADARQKAADLLDSIHEKLGPALRITENDNSVYPPAGVYQKEAGFSARGQIVPLSDLEVKKIKVEAKVQTIFQILP